MKTVALLLAAQSAAAFPFVVRMPGVNSALLSDSKPVVERRNTCPNNPDHKGAAPYTAQFPYLGAVNGSRGTGKGGIQVPAPGDTAHAFTPPGPLDIRGPCPGLNTLANHNFLSHDGITTYNDLIDAQQNVYNIGFNLANLLAIAGVGLDGDLVTGRLSIGCDADSRTNLAPGVAGDEPGLNGHNKFEADASLTRMDYFLGDNHNFNGELFGQMAAVTGGKFDRQGLALYRYMRYWESRNTNADFFFGPGSLLMYGAASFLYGAFASGGLQGNPDLATQMSFFGAQKTSSGNYTFNNEERIPDKWYNSVQAYDDQQVGNEIGSMYGLHPVPFGANVGQAGDFNAMNFSQTTSEGYLLNSTTPENIMCLMYQLVTSGFPTSLSTVYQLPADSLAFALGKLAPGYKDLGCPTPLYPGEIPVVDDNNH